METKISDYLISYKTVENATEVLLCSVKANPNPVKIEWYKDHKLLGKYEKKTPDRFFYCILTEAYREIIAGLIILKREPHNIINYKVL